MSEGLSSVSCSWVDYLKDGDLDLFASNGGNSDTVQSCELYRNDGGANSWIVLDLVGTVSNSSAIGAKVWTEATIDGQTVIQLREVSGGGNGASQMGPRVHFGLGDAATVDTLTIEWPSGIVQDMNDVATEQFLEVVEPGDPLMRGAPVDGFETDWFGYYNTAYAPWLFHGKHGFIYRDPESTSASMFVYDHAMGAWWWSSRSVYPFIYAYDPPANDEGTDIGLE